MPTFIKRILAIVVAVAVLVAFNAFMSRGGLFGFGLPYYYAEIINLTGISIILAVSLNLITGFTGQFSIGHAGFMAVGAYASVFLTVYYSNSAEQWLTGILGATLAQSLVFLGVILFGALIAAVAGLVVGIPSLRLRGDYLAIVTLAFGEIIRIVLINWQSFTGGPNGVSAPRPSFFGIPFTSGDDGFAATFGLEFSSTHRVVFLFYVILVLALITNWVTIRLRRLPVGRAWEAMREDEIACRSLGINTTNTKLTAFAIGAMFGGFAGAFFATRQGFISPESFVFMESALILAIALLERETRLGDAARLSRRDQAENPRQRHRRNPQDGGADAVVALRPRRLYDGAIRARSLGGSVSPVGRPHRGQR